jgi:hypothetical protein
MSREHREHVRKVILDIVRRGQPRSWPSIKDQYGFQLWELLGAWNSLRKEGLIPLAKMFVIDWYSPDHNEDKGLTSHRPRIPDTRASVWLTPNPKHGFRALTHDQAKDSG